MFINIIFKNNSDESKIKYQNYFGNYISKICSRFFGGDILKVLSFNCEFHLIIIAVHKLK